MNEVELVVVVREEDGRVGLGPPDDGSLDLVGVFLVGECCHDTLRGDGAVQRVDRDARFDDLAL
ncbi:hypothetical protein [Streptomyces sp. NPDC006925]|uniref:hypothetical protein n=1 Tax=Streptomyces sp. NPDC006925 TaxID=3364768 RepID=UPI0036CFFA26